MLAILSIYDRFCLQTFLVNKESPIKFYPKHMDAGGWMDRKMKGWMDGRTDGRTDGWLDGWMYGWMNNSILIDAQAKKKTRPLESFSSPPQHLLHRCIIRK